LAGSNDLFTTLIHPAIAAYWGSAYKSRHWEWAANDGLTHPRGTVDAFIVENNAGRPCGPAFPSSWP
jgi:hypothetical protein